MMIPRTPVAAHAPKLDDLVRTLRREAEGAEGDPFDDAMAAGVAGLVEAMRDENAELEVLRGRMVRLARQVAR